MIFKCIGFPIYFGNHANFATSENYNGKSFFFNSVKSVWYPLILETIKAPKFMSFKLLLPLKEVLSSSMELPPSVRLLWELSLFSMSVRYFVFSSQNFHDYEVNVAFWANLTSCTCPKLAQIARKFSINIKKISNLAEMFLL